MEGSAESLYGMATLKHPKHSVEMYWVAGLSILAWSLAVLPLGSFVENLAPDRFEFSLPRVCVPYTPGTDVVSTVPFLFSAAALALAGLLVVEVAKLLVTASPTRRTALPLALSVFQITLAIDILRKYAWDWYGYGLYFARLISLSYERPKPEVLPVPTPWCSFIMLLVCLALLLRPPYPKGPGM